MIPEQIKQALDKIRGRLDALEAASKIPELARIAATDLTEPDKIEAARKLLFPINEHDALTKAKSAIESLIEWRQVRGRISFCIFCVNNEQQGHMPHCPRIVALSAINAILEP